MIITEKHLKVLRSSYDRSKGKTVVFNRGDAEECVEMGLVEPEMGWPLTKQGKNVLQTYKAPA